MVSLFLSPSVSSEWIHITFRCGRRTLGRPTIIPAADAWQVHNATYRAALAYSTGAITDLYRTGATR